MLWANSAISRLIRVRVIKSYDESDILLYSEWILHSVLFRDDCFELLMSADASRCRSFVSRLGSKLRLPGQLPQDALFLFGLLEIGLVRNENRVVFKGFWFCHDLFLDFFDATRSELDESFSI